MRNIICIGASTGGLDAITRLVRAIPANLPAAIFFVRHIADHGEALLPQILNPHSALPVAMAEEGDEISPGRILIAPPNRHLVLDRNRVLLSAGPKENWVRPAIDPLFRTAAQFHGPRSIGIILSGKLDDGTAGLWALKRRGGFAVVQQPSDAIAPDMPRNALAAVKVDAVADAEEIGAMLPTWCAQASDFAPDDLVRKSLEVENAFLFRARTGTAMLDEVGLRQAIVCPDCGGELWKLKTGPLRFRCHTGHAMSAATLRAQQSSVVEVAGWHFIRALEEDAFLIERLLENEIAPDSKQSLAAELSYIQAQVKKVRSIVEKRPDTTIPMAALGPDSDVSRLEA